MIYVPPTVEYEGDRPSIFLAGGVTDCPAWQQQLIELLARTNLVVMNPRWTVWNAEDPEGGQRQIEWEYRHLRRATARLFWFPCETVCPIALFELGSWTRTNEPLFVGIHSAYRRRFDLEVQLRLARPEIEIVYSLDDLANQVLGWEASL